MRAADYLSSLREDSYWKYIWVWDAEQQKWLLIEVGAKDEEGNPVDILHPGQAFWIYMYEEQDLLPPSPT